MFTEKDFDILARTIYGEARGEIKLSCGLKGLQAVAWVIKNRFHKNLKKTIAQVCQTPYQFSCWNKSDPNRNIILELSLNDDMYQCCYEVGKSVLFNKNLDPTCGANHYHSCFIMPPYWADEEKKTKIIGNHVFYKL